ncbi:MAG: hypothetical protein KDA91_14950 [Planctomycetaceae bacterium]|nr:hypothetical protein [Planctomycetaceae bacterium]
MSEFGKRMLGPAALMVVFVAMNSTAVQGGLNHLFGGSGCNCNSSQPQVSYVPVQPVVAPVMQAGCACSSAAAGCCGMGGLGSVGGLYMDAAAGMGYGPAFGMVGQGMTGYEGLPNMDGGGVNYRYPYHSYRRPWANPGPRAANVSIVW